MIFYIRERTLRDFMEGNSRRPPIHRHMQRSRALGGTYAVWTEPQTTLREVYSSGTNYYLYGIYYYTILILLMKRVNWWRDGWRTPVGHRTYVDRRWKRLVAAARRCPPSMPGTWRAIAAAVTPTTGGDGSHLSFKVGTHGDDRLVSAATRSFRAHSTRYLSHSLSL